MKQIIIDFLRKEGILGPNNEKWTIIFNDQSKRKIDMVELIEKFTNSLKDEYL